MKIFCSGIGGIGLSALAQLLKCKGHNVSGSDRGVSEITKLLESISIPVSPLQDGTALEPDTELFIYSEAIPENAPERIKARELGIRQVSYFGALGEVSKDQRTVCIAGTHGKSSTTAMLAYIAQQAGLDPTVIVGTKVPQLNRGELQKYTDHPGGTNVRVGATNLWIIESCEYRRSFLNLSPKNIIITNTDGDHFDSFKDHTDYCQAFREFIQKIPTDGNLITHQFDTNTSKIIHGLPCIHYFAQEVELPTLLIPGMHMRCNAQLAVRMAMALGIDKEKALTIVRNFRGTWRRMEVIGSLSTGQPVIDDYAHHPVEIEASLQGIREQYPKKRILLAFQPHTHHRTNALYSGFVQALQKADEVLLINPYVARSDIEIETSNMNTLCNDIVHTSKTLCTAQIPLESAVEVILQHLRSDDVLVLMGAGNVDTIRNRLPIV